MCTADSGNISGMSNDKLYQQQLQLESFQTRARYDSRSGKQIYTPIPKDQLATAPNPYRDELTRRGDEIRAQSAADRAAFDAQSAAQQQALATRQEQMRNEQLGRAAELDAAQRESARQITLAQDAVINARNGAVKPAASRSKAPTAGGGMPSRRKKRGGSRDAGPSLRIDGGGTGLNIGA